jgi:hypothetical protein
MSQQERDAARRLADMRSALERGALFKFDSTSRQAKAASQQRSLARIRNLVSDVLDEPGRATTGLPGILHRGELRPWFDLIDDLAEHLTYAWLKDSSRQTYTMYSQHLVRYARERQLPANNLTYKLMSGFAISYVVAGNQARGLYGYLSAWKQAVRDYGWTLTEEAETRMRCLVRTLVTRLATTYRPNYAYPWLAEFTRKYAIKVLTNTGGTLPLADVWMMAALEFSRATGMRASTRFQSAQQLLDAVFPITKSSVQWNDKNGARLVTVLVPPGKSGPERRVAFRFNPADPMCTYCILRRWYDDSGMAAQPASAPFIPALSGGTINWSAEMPRNEFVIRMKHIANFIGLPASYIARLRGHSPRAGCATDLFARGATLEQVKCTGGWASAKALLYVRITAEMMADWTAMDDPTFEILPNAILSNVSLAIANNTITSASLDVTHTVPSDQPAAEPFIARGAGNV